MGLSVFHMAFITENEGRDGWTLTTNKGPRPNSNCGHPGSWSTPCSPLGCPVITFFTWGVFFWILNHLPEIISNTLKNSPNPYLQPLHSELSLFLSPPVSLSVPLTFDPDDRKRSMKDVLFVWHPLLLSHHLPFCFSCFVFNSVFNTYNSDAPPPPFEGTGVSGGTPSGQK